MTIESENQNEGIITSQKTLNFSQLDWNVPQTVTVQGIDDLEMDGDKEHFIRLVDTGSVPNFETVKISIINEDDDQVCAIL